MLKTRNQNRLKNYIQPTVTPGNRNYREFMTTSQFARVYGQSPLPEKNPRVPSYIANSILAVLGLTNYAPFMRSGRLTALPQNPIASQPSMWMAARA
ncbi:protease pro-enzyme activation domain-containing protein [Alicyclobacillus sp. ALC3]|uniref:protease pro-enzyme activation domain-containing protein n=1 Tax=Alicyclobacillus sp. ALC3 TaxID=2796143 RepID=UPI003FCE0F69